MLRKSNKEKKKNHSNFQQRMRSKVIDGWWGGKGRGEAGELKPGKDKEEDGGCSWQELPSCYCMCELLPYYYMACYAAVTKDIFIDRSARIV